MLNYDYDIAIIGAGPVGLTVASLLGQQNIQCVLIEQNEIPFSLPRAQTLDDESLRTLQSFALAEQFLPKTRSAQGSHYYDASGERFADIGPGPQNYGFPKRNYMLQHQLDAELRENLSKYPSVNCFFEVRLSDIQQDLHGVDLTVINQHDEQRVLRSAYVLACDGGRSFIRRALGIGMSGWTYGQDWVVLDMLDDPDQDAVSKFFCDPARPAVSIASPNGGRRYEFMLLEGETSEQALQPSFLAELLKPFRSYDERFITRATVYTFHARIAERLQQERVLLLGDAAHLTPPFAGQGLNAGIRDAHNVAWKIAAVVQGIADPLILQSYELERREPIWAMIQLAVAMGEFVMPRGAKQLALKNSMMEALERFPEVKDYLFQMRFKPKPRYKDGLFLDLHEQSFEASLVGEMIPQPSVIDEDHNECLLDDVLGPGFAMIAQNEEGEACLAQLDHGLLQQLNPRRIRLFSADQTLLPGSIDRAVVIGESIYARPLLTHRDQILLVRPDRYALGAFFPAQAQQFCDRLQRLLQP